jgi:LacI family transcriptional regulator
MAVTLNDVAQLAGVSVSTVSRVLNEKSKTNRISLVTQARVREAAKELNYRPNRLARGLRLKRTQTLGLITPDITNPFFAHIVKCVQQEAHSLGYSLVVCNTDEDLTLELEHINLLLQNRVDGLIAMPVGQESEHFKDWIGRGRPLVLLDRYMDDVGASSVVVDNFAGAKEATEYLIRHGHQRIAVIQGLPDTYTSVQRLEGYSSALEEAGIPVDPSLIVGGDFRRESGYIGTKLVLNLSAPPTAIFSMSDLITLGALQAIKEEELEIPADMSLVTFDDFDFAPFLKCPVTAIRQPKEMMGETAVKLLVEQLTSSKSPAKHLTLKPKLIRRDSVSTPAGNGTS